MVGQLEICSAEYIRKRVLSYASTSHTYHSFIMFHCHMDKIFELVRQNETDRTRLKTAIEEEKNQHQHGYKRKFVFVTHVFC